jgi:tRNA G18 (ribose-2'-O)-methylase SpoU
MRGYFGIGMEEVSKPMNVGALMRTAHAFGASFFFTINAHFKVRDAYRSDTSRSFEHVPYYAFDSVEEMLLPKNCALVGVELLDDAVDLPSFRHPPSAAYVLGRERGSLSPALQARCAHVVKIPTKFCLNVGLAGALLMYDRAISIGGYPARPIMPGGPAPELNEAVRARKE